MSVCLYMERMKDKVSCLRFSLVFISVLSDGTVSALSLQ